MAGEKEKIDTLNRFGVGSQGENTVILSRIPHVLDKAQALNLAAYLIVIADPGRKDFEAVLEAILNT